MPGTPADRDTQIGGSARDFPSTCWSRFMQAGEDAPDAGIGPLAALAQAYWKPIYTYIRCRRNVSNEDAKDLTQDFFAWMIETGFIRKAGPDRGKFRGFLKIALSHFLTDANRGQLRERRGGGRTLMSLDLPASGEEPASWEDSAAAAPDTAFEEAWKDALLHAAWERLEQSYAREGREVYFRVFKDFYLSDESADYRELAQRHGVSVGDVSNFLMNAKRRFRSVITDLVAETVRGPEELEEELRQLFGIGRS